MPPKKKFDLPDWLTNPDEYAGVDIDVFMSPKYKDWVAARDEFDALSQVILERDPETSDLTLGDEDPQQERLEELHAQLEQLTPKVLGSRKILRFVDAVTRRDLDAIDAKFDGDKVGSLFELLTTYGLFDGKSLSFEEWENLARKVGVWQWDRVWQQCITHIGRGGEITPDFSLPSLPHTRE